MSFDKEQVKCELEKYIEEEGAKLREQYQNMKRWLLDQVDTTKNENIIEIMPVPQDPLNDMAIKHFVWFVKSKGYTVEDNGRSRYILKKISPVNIK